MKTTRRMSVKLKNDMQEFAFIPISLYKGKLKYEAEEYISKYKDLAFQSKFGFTYT